MLRACGRHASQHRARETVRVSSPWPERIAIDTVALGGVHTCRVEGRVVYANSAETTSAGSPGERVVIRIPRDSVWRTDDYDVVQN